MKEKTDGEGGGGADGKRKGRQQCDCEKGNGRRKDGSGTWKSTGRKSRMRKDEERKVPPPSLLISLILNGYSSALRARMHGSAGNFLPLIIKSGPPGFKAYKIKIKLDLE